MSAVIIVSLSTSIINKKLRTLSSTDWHFFTYLQELEYLSQAVCNDILLQQIVSLDQQQAGLYIRAMIHVIHEMNGE